MRRLALLLLLANLALGGWGWWHDRPLNPPPPPLPEAPDTIRLWSEVSGATPAAPKDAGASASVAPSKATAEAGAAHGEQPDGQSDR
jgi:hypothetical protein